MLQEGLVLEEVEMPALLRGRVVHRAVSRAARLAREAPASGEVDLDIETAPLGIEGAGLAHARRDQSERQLH